MQFYGQEKKSIKAVLDTNILISAYLFRKRLGTIAELIHQDIIVPCFIVSTFGELAAVLEYPKFSAIIKRNNSSSKKILSTIRFKSIISPNPEKIPKFVSDFPDNFIIASAVVNKVDYLVTGDRLILDLKKKHNIPIITPRDFLQKFINYN